MKKIFITLALLLLASTTFAAPVSRSQALQIAKNFWNTCSAILAEKYQWNEVAVPVDYHHCYFFAVDTVGFVLVSKDDRLTPILGYSISNPLAPDQLPVQFVDWMNDRQKEFDYLCEQVEEAPDSIRRTWEALNDGGALPKNIPHEVLPLLKTTWNQWYPYNMFSPRVDNQDCPSGCVATAMAQLMKYWNYPSHGRGSHSIMAGTLSADFEHTNYAWDLMLNNYRRSHNLQQDSAVGLLLLHCAIAVDMVFSPTGSSAIGYNYNGDTNNVCSPNALRNYFRYAPDYVSVDCAHYSFSEYNSMLRKELDAHRPILYSGHTQSGSGHQFICDGYRPDGLFHFNWGWDGFLDGYFVTSYLYPEGNPEHFRDAYSINHVTMNIRPAERLHTSVSRLTLPRRESDTSFTLYSTYDDTSSWQLVERPSWVTLSQTSGLGAGTLSTLTLSSQENIDSIVRSGTLVFVHGTDTARVTLYQYSDDPEDMCQLVVTVGDTYHNGWEGAYLLFYSPSGFEFGTAYTNGIQSVFNIPVCSDSVYMAWVPGSCDDQCTYSVSNSHGYFFLEDTGAFLSPILIETPCVELPCETVDSFPWTEDFEEAMLLHCYRRIDRDGDGYYWMMGDPSYGDQGHDGSASAAVSSSYMNGVGALVPDNWLITPALHLSDSAASRFSWWVASHNRYDYAEHYSVLLSNTGNSTSDFTHTLFEETLTESGYRQRFVSLVDYQGETVYIAFRHYNCSNQFFISVDDLRIDFDSMPDTSHVSIATAESARWNVYPNPVRGWLSVSNADEEPFGVALYNSEGQQVFVEVEAHSQEVRCDVGKLPAGVYILRLTSPTATQVRRIVIQ